MQLCSKRVISISCCDNLSSPNDLICHFVPQATSYDFSPLREIIFNTLRINELDQIL